MKIAIFGAGYVGLVQAAVLADAGHSLVCVDVDAEKVENLNKGIIPIYEPQLEPLVKEGIALGRLQFSCNAEDAIGNCEIIFIAVGTPPDDDGSADLQYVLAVAETIALHMNGYKIVVNKSTVPVGTADKVHHRIRTGLDKRNVDYDFDVVSNPEFLKEGDAVNDCKRPDRIIIGTTSVKAEDTMRELYAPFNRNHDKVLLMGVRSAELTKYAANCMLATKISFMNEMANLAERLGADIEEVRLGIGSDSRIGYSFIYPGAGYGGSCFPKDVRALIRTAQSLDYPSRILDAVDSVNDRQKQRLLELIDQHYSESGTSGRLAAKVFAVWGLSFKPQTDDVREATSRVVIEGLWHRGAKVQAYDPEAMEEIQRIYGSRDDLRLCGTKEAALEGADALIICTEWKHFWAPDFDQLHDKLGDRAIFDGRNIYDPHKIKELGFAYYGIGRGLSVSRDGGL
ncbi:MAG: UDP-glucose/GDP-mannose dehydrogenase family protein [Proteobacteria bacterium]|nr:UDP-glucose/GDP-mannose dehydrogenase family protein [Pseudomonadota bacterium]